MKIIVHQLTETIPTHMPVCGDRYLCLETQTNASWPTMVSRFVPESQIPVHRSAGRARSEKDSAAYPDYGYLRVRNFLADHRRVILFFFFLNDPAPPEISPLPLPAPLPI